MAPPHHHYPQGGSTRIYVDENGYPVSASQQPPDGSVGSGEMTPDKLRFIADYVDECDSLIAKVLVQAGVDLDAEQAAFIAGKQVQADLRRWADELDPSQKTACEVSDG